MSDQLQHALAKHRRQPLEPKPGNAWEVIADHRVTQLEKQIADLQTKILALVWSVIGTVALGGIAFIVRSIWP